jgi:hypothetical protein
MRVQRPVSRRPSRQAVRARLAAAALLLALAPPMAFAGPAAPSDTARVRLWREDLRFTVDRVHALHPRPFAHVPRAAFDSAAADVERHFSAYDDRRLAVEMMRMVALLDDGHTMLIGTLPPAGFRSVVPVLVRPFEDGLYVTAAASDHRDLVGTRVRRIGGVSAEEALERVASIASGDNRYTRLDRVPLFLMLPGVLHALGITSDPERIALEVEGPGGATRTVTVAGGPPPDGFPMAFNETEPLLPAGWVGARRTGTPPRCDRRPEEAWWAEMLPGRVLYLRMRRVDPVSGERTFGRFLGSTFALADSAGAEALVLDLRHDHGGNNTILDALVRRIVERPWLDRPGRLLVLTDRGTFSAAMNACVFLEWQTEAMFVGEPPGGRPNHVGDADDLQPPNLGMLLMVSRWPWSARLPWDDRPWIAPHVAVPARFAEWRDGVDPVLDAALEVIERGTVSEHALAAARTGGVAAALAACRTWVERHPNPWRSIEGDLAATVRRGLDLGPDEPLLAVAQAGAELFPHSAGSWSRLGQTQSALGRRAEAIASLRHALELDAEWGPARALLERLERSP